MRSETVLSTRVDLVDLDEAGRMVAAWALTPVGRMVCAANVHMVMEAHDDASFGRMVNGADLIVADGRPLVWACSLLGSRGVAHLRGLDVTVHLCDVAEREGLTVGLYGGEPATTDLMRRRLLGLYPRLDLAYAWSPPFRPLTPDEDAAAIKEIHLAGVQLLFVGLGCPKQERWMAVHRDRLTCVMVGVGAVFDMVAGRQQVAPRWMQRAGLEWVYRLALEPGRLWRRYAKHNVRFVALLGWQWLAGRRSAARPM